MFICFIILFFRGGGGYVHTLLRIFIIKRSLNPTVFMCVSSRSPYKVARRLTPLLIPLNLIRLIKTFFASMLQVRRGITHHSRFVLRDVT